MLGWLIEDAARGSSKKRSRARLSLADFSDRNFIDTWRPSRVAEYLSHLSERGLLSLHVQQYHHDDVSSRLSALGQIDNPGRVGSQSAGNDDIADRLRLFDIGDRKQWPWGSIKSPPQIVESISAWPAPGGLR